MMNTAKNASQRAAAIVLNSGIKKEKSRTVDTRVRRGYKSRKRGDYTVSPRGEELIEPRLRWREKTWRVGD